MRKSTIPTTTASSTAQTVPLGWEIENQAATQEQNISKNIEQTIRDSKKLQKQIDELNKKLVDKNTLSWQDKKQIQDLLEKQKQIKETKSRENQSIRVDSERMDKLIDLIGELVISSAAANLREPRNVNELLIMISYVVSERGQPVTAAIIEAAVKLTEAVLDDLTA